MRKIGLASAVLMTGLSSPAAAGDWWLVHSGGTKPARVSVAVEEGSIRPVPFADNMYRLESIVVLEGAKQPAWVTSNVTVDCNAQKIKEELIQITPRGGALQRAPDRPFRAFEDEADARVAAFACSMGSASEAARVAMRKEMAGGIRYLGDLTIIGVEERVWASLWADGKRPADTNVRSIEEQERVLADLAERRKRALGEAGAVADRVIATEAAEREERDRFAAREKREPVPVRRSLEPWIGHRDTELVSRWGTPTRYEDEGPRRLVHYYRTSAVAGPDPSGGCGAGNMHVPDPNSKNGGMMCVGGGPARSDTAIDCTASFEVRGGTIVDYFTRGNCAAVLGK